MHISKFFFFVNIVCLFSRRLPTFYCFSEDLQVTWNLLAQASWAPVGTGAGALLLTGGDDGRARALGFAWMAHGVWFNPCEDLSI